MAMKMGKHTYCQKPMTHSVYEARRMAEVARATKVATQVAVGNSASEATRLLCEWIWAGAIGPVRRVENWSSRPFWPQGIDQPDKPDPVPPGLDWDLWLGPAPARPFNHVYLPFVWRGWYDFGAGALGDMGQYSFDTIFRVLKLTAPSAVEASSTKLFDETFPRSVRYSIERIETSLSRIEAVAPEKSPAAAAADKLLEEIRTGQPAGIIRAGLHQFMLHIQDSCAEISDRAFQEYLKAV